MGVGLKMARRRPVSGVRVLFVCLFVLLLLLLFCFRLFVCFCFVCFDFFLLLFPVLFARRLAPVVGYCRLVEISVPRSVGIPELTN